MVGLRETKSQALHPVREPNEERRVWLEMQPRYCRCV
jgi:hypothetical protein